MGHICIYLNYHAPVQVPNTLFTMCLWRLTWLRAINGIANDIYCAAHVKSVYVTMLRQNVTETKCQTNKQSKMLNYGQKLLDRRFSFVHDEWQVITLWIIGILLLRKTAIYLL